jgi:hypothetical protein
MQAMSLAAWFDVRRSTFVSIILGTLSWGVAFVVLWQVWPEGPALATAADRLAYAAQLLAGVAALVLLMVSACFRVFDTERAEDPFANAESAAWKVHQRVLQNTIEQSLIFVPAMLALAVRIDPAHARLLPLLTALWCAGRLLFWIGYRIKPILRGPGFEWTLFSSLTALGWFAFTL